MARGILGTFRSKFSSLFEPRKRERTGKILEANAGDLIAFENCLCDIGRKKRHPNAVTDDFRIHAG